MKLAYLTLALAVTALVISAYNLKRVVKGEGTAEDANRNTIGSVAILSSCHVLNRIEGNALTLLDYILIASSILIVIIIGYSAWISYRKNKS